LVLCRPGVLHPVMLVEVGEEDMVVVFAVVLPVI